MSDEKATASEEVAATEPAAEPAPAEPATEGVTAEAAPEVQIDPEPKVADEETLATITQTLLAAGVATTADGHVTVQALNEELAKQGYAPVAAADRDAAHAEPEPEPEPVAADTIELEPTLGLASQPVRLVAEAPDAPPTSVGDQIGHDTLATTRHRVAIWLAETKYFLSTLQHEVAGEHGELIKALKERL